MVAVVAMGIVAATTTSVQAQANIITPVSATSNATLGPAWTIDKAIDGSFLSGGGASGDILSETHAPDAQTGSHYLSANGVVPELTFDLGGTFTVDSVHIWNYRHQNGTVNWGASSMDISFSTDGGTTYGSLIDDVGLGTFVTAGNPESVQSVSFTAVSGVTHIKLTDVKHLGGPYTGFGEIRFGAGAAAPATPGTLIYGK